MRYFVVVDRRKIQKTAENREPETPWKGESPQEYLFFVTYTLHSLRIFSGFYLTKPETIRKLCSI